MINQWRPLQHYTYNTLARHILARVNCIAPLVANKIWSPSEAIAYDHRPKLRPPTTHSNSIIQNLIVLVWNLHLETCFSKICAFSIPNTRPKHFWQSTGTREKIRRNKKKLTIKENFFSQPPHLFFTSWFPFMPLKPFLLKNSENIYRIFLGVLKYLFLYRKTLVDKNWSF
jgi:hypothetical protein